jgi:uncharacterized protein YndB with AHSA1/START domain
MSREHELTASVLVECDLPDPPEKVWRALTVPELLAAWLMPNDIRPEPGSRFRLRQGPGSGSGDGPIECEVLAAEPNRLLRLSWRGGDDERDAQGRQLDSIVTFELSETPAGGTHLRLVHSGLPTSLRAPIVMRRRGSAVAISNTLTRLPWAA